MDKERVAWVWLLHIRHAIYGRKDYRLNEWKDILRLFQHIAKLYGDNILRRDEIKDGSPLIHMLAGCEFKLASGLRFLASDAYY